jgi:hypothetical protein
LHQQPDDSDYLEIAEQKALEKETRALALIEIFSAVSGLPVFRNSDKKNRPRCPVSRCPRRYCFNVFSR